MADGNVTAAKACQQGLHCGGALFDVKALSGRSTRRYTSLSSSTQRCPGPPATFARPAPWSGVDSVALDGQRDDERCPGPRSPATRADVAAVSLDEGLGDRESDSRATVLAVAGGTMY